MKIINYNCSGHKFNIFLKYFGSIFKTELSVICSLWNIFAKRDSIENYVLNVLTFEIVCAQYKRGNSSLYLIFLLICQFIIECTDVDAFVAALDIDLLHFIRFLWLLLVERSLIIHFRLNVSYHYFSFVVNSFNLTVLLLPSVNRKYFFRVSHLFEYQLLEIFKVWPF